MARLMSELKAFLTEDGLRYYQTTCPDHLVMSVTVLDETVRCIVEVNEVEEQVLFFAMIEAIIPEEKHIEVALHLTDVNAGRTIGSFDFDRKDRLVAYRTSIQVEETPLTGTLIRPLLEHAIAMALKYGPEILAIVHRSVLSVDVPTSVKS